MFFRNINNSISKQKNSSCSYNCSSYRRFSNMISRIILTTNQTSLVFKSPLPQSQPLALALSNKLTFFKNQQRMVGCQRLENIIILKKKKKEEFCNNKTITF
jgi:hypothetical protein